jgi:predicted DsbA family dithiol-disulfide isomerase
MRSERNAVRVELWSDVTCPWCFLGKRRMEGALRRLTEQRPELEVEIVHRPFQLFPYASRETHPLDEADSAGAGVHTAGQVSGYIREVLLPLGGDVTRWQPAWRPNTFDVHRLLVHALETEGWRTQFALSEELEQAHFLRGLDISRTSVLAEAAETAGVADAGEVLATGRWTGEVRTALTEGLVSGVTVVPTYVVGGRSLEGAQPVEALVDLVTEVQDGTAVHDPVVRAYRLAQAVLDRNDPLGALQLLAPVLAEHADYRSVLSLAGMAYFRSGQLRRARTTLERLVELDPSDHYARFLLGRVYERASRTEEAVSQFRIAAAMAPLPDYRIALTRSMARLA